MNRFDLTIISISTYQIGYISLNVSIKLTLKKILKTLLICASGAVYSQETERRIFPMQT